MSRRAAGAAGGHAGGDVNAGGVAEDVVQGLRLGDVAAGAAEDDDQLGLVVEDVGVDLRQDDGAAGAEDGVGGLEEAPHRRGLAVAELAEVAAHGQQLRAWHRRLERHGRQRLRGALGSQARQLRLELFVARDQRLHGVVPAEGPHQGADVDDAALGQQARPALVEDHQLDSPSPLAFLGHCGCRGACSLGAGRRRRRTGTHKGRSRQR